MKSDLCRVSSFSHDGAFALSYAKVFSRHIIPPRARALDHYHETRHILATSKIA